MRLELRVTRGARAGHRQGFEDGTVTLGRDPASEFRLDPERDLDASARHAEIRRLGDDWRIRDAGSRNGTFVNWQRIAGDRMLRDGDIIALGRDGPTIEARLLPVVGAPPSMPLGRSDTAQRIERAVRTRTGTLRRALVAVIALAVVGGAGAFIIDRRGATRREAQLLLLAARNDSLDERLGRELASLTGRLAGLDAALAEARRESDGLRRELERERSRATSASLAELEARLGEAERRRASLASAASIDHARAAAASGPAVVLIAVEMPDGSRHTGTGFSVAEDGVIVTNRHVVRDSSGALPARIAVIFAGTHRWVEARVLRVSDDAELALLRVAVAGRYPVVTGLAGGSTIPVGAPVTVIGYPLGLDTPMGGARESFTARASLGAGTVSKVLPDLVQIDAWAGQGSSGSPVFDAEGRVAGVIFGGARESGGRLVYAAPASQVRRLLEGSPRE